MNCGPFELRRTCFSVSARSCRASSRSCRSDAAFSALPMFVPGTAQATMKTTFCDRLLRPVPQAFMAGGRRQARSARGRYYRAAGSLVLSGRQYLRLSRSIRRDCARSPD
jgi:hypothetical protein